MSESANPLTANGSAATAVLNALLKWQSGRLNNAQLQAFVRETLASATPELLHRFESCAEDDAAFQEVCNQLIDRLTHSGRTHSESVAVSSGFTNVVRSERPSFATTEELDVEFLPDEDEPLEEAPRRVFDPVMALQTVDGFIRFTTYDYLSVPRVIMAACIGTVCALPWIIENPEFSKDPGYSVYGPKPESFASGQESSQDRDAFQTDSNSGTELSGLSGDDETNVQSLYSTEANSEDILGQDTPLAVAVAPESADQTGSIEATTDQVESTQSQGLAGGSDADNAEIFSGGSSPDVDPSAPIEEPDLESLLSPYVDGGRVIEPRNTDAELRTQILEQLHNREFESVAKSISELTNNSEMKSWLAAEIALRQQSPEARLQSWRNLLESTSTELLDDLLCARLLLTSSATERKEFLNVARELSFQPSPDSVAARYLRWALSWSKRSGRDLASEISRYASDEVSRGSIDAIFAANASFAQSNVSDAYTQLVDSQIALQAIQPADLDDISAWIHGESVEDLQQKVRRTINGLSGRLTTTPR